MATITNKLSLDVNKELIVSSNQSEVRIALLEDKRLVEYSLDKTNSNHIVGDVYLGKVKKINPGLNACFVDVGYSKDAFLHFFDLGINFLTLNNYVKNITNGTIGHNISSVEIEKEIEKTGKISQLISVGQNILVQIAKEPISTKGPRLTSEISFAGRFLVLMPFSNKISISQKIKSSEERNRLKRLIQSICPKNFGIIIRTVAENVKVAELDADLKNLLSKWEIVESKLPVSIAPQKIVSEIDKTTAILRDLLNESFNSIVIDDISLFQYVRSFILNIAPSKVDIVKNYKGKLPIFENYNIEKQLKSGFGKTVTVKNGIYLIIEHTEAMHVIDVNSGNKSNSSQSQEINALEVNLESAKEIARQLRLRDLGGIIVVDFIDLHNPMNRKALYDFLINEMSKDRAKHTILPPSKFGIIQITRQRVRPQIDIEIQETCPACGGSGKVRSSSLFIDELENYIKYLVNEQNEKSLTLFVHPFIYAYLQKGLLSIKTKWFFKYKKNITIKPNSSFHILEFKFFNKNKEEINF